MKSNIIVACAIALGCGMFANSAQAAIVNFNMFDHNHDGRWDRADYYAARRYYHHHGAYYGFDRWDRNRDGYLTPVEVRAVRTW